MAAGRQDFLVAECYDKKYDIKIVFSMCETRDASLCYVGSYRDDP